MADPVKVTDPTVIDPLLAASKIRNPSLIIGPSAQIFTDPTVFYKDDTHGGLYAMSLRGKTTQFLEWSWASTADGLVPTLDELVKIFTSLLNDARAAFGAKLPYSGIFNDRCPWINELTNAKTNFLIVQRVTQAINQVLPNTVVQFDPPQSVILEQKNSAVNFGLVYAQTIPLLLDERQAI